MRFLKELGVVVCLATLAMGANAQTPEKEQETPTVQAESITTASRTKNFTRILPEWPKILTAGQPATFSGRLEQKKNGRYSGFVGTVTLEVVDASGNKVFSSPPKATSDANGNFSIGTQVPGRKGDRRIAKLVFDATTGVNVQPCSIKRDSYYLK
jgi:hypothetical protein